MSSSKIGGLLIILLSHVLERFNIFLGACGFQCGIFKAGFLIENPLGIGTTVLTKSGGMLFIVIDLFLVRFRGT